MSDTAITIRYLNEEDMIKAGVLDATDCIETIEEVLGLLSDGDVLMGGKNHYLKGVPWKISHILFRLSIISEKAPSIVSVNA
jgi:hypothetical protein